MTPKLVLMRGINVGGKNKVPMADLRDLLEELGFTKVSTYVASGDVILESSKRADRTRAQIEDALPRKFKLDEPIRVLVLTRRQLQSVIDGKPNGFGDQPGKYHKL